MPTPDPAPPPRSNRPRAAMAPTAVPALPFTAYRHAVSQAVVALDVHSERPADFRGALTAGGAGDIHVFGIRADEHGVHRTSALIARARALLQVLPHRARHRAHRAGRPGERAAARRHGDLRHRSPYSLLFDEPCAWGRDVPEGAARHPRGDGRPNSPATRLDGMGGIGAMIGPYLASLARGARRLDAHLARRLFRTAVDWSERSSRSNRVRTRRHRCARRAHATVRSTTSTST